MSANLILWAWITVEAMIYLATSGVYAGEYVASCTTDNCGSLGEFSDLHR